MRCIRLLILAVFLLIPVLGVAQPVTEGQMIALMRMDTEGNVPDSLDTVLVDALRTEILNAGYKLDSRDSTVSFKETQFLTGCDRGDSIACYEAACEYMGAQEMIFGQIDGNGETDLTWYVSGKGVYRKVSGGIKEQREALALARRLLVGEMGNLVVTSNIQGADVFIDGVKVGFSSDNVESAEVMELRTGNYIVAVRMEGYQREDAQKIEVLADETTYFHVDLIALEDVSNMGKTMRVTGWVLFGTGLASLATAGSLAGVQYYGQRKYNRAVSHGLRAGDDLLNFLSNTKKKYNHFVPQMVMWGVGGVLTAGGIAMLAVGYFYNFSEDGVTDVVEDGSKAEEDSEVKEVVPSESDEMDVFSLIPRVDISVGSEYQGVGLEWRF